MKVEGKEQKDTDQGGLLPTWLQFWTQGEGFFQEDLKKLNCDTA